MDPFWVPDATRTIPLLASPIESCRALALAVIFTAFARTHEFLGRPRFGAQMRNRYPHVPHDPAWFLEGRIVSELQPRAGEIVIFKPSDGAFYDTPLETILKNLGRDTIIISGTLTNFCCGEIFGSDVTATDDPIMHENELRVLRKGFARVMRASDIVAALRVAAGVDASPNGRFRAYTGSYLGLNAASRSLWNAVPASGLCCRGATAAFV